MTTAKKTVLFDTHLAHGAQMVEFGGWQMPIQYRHGVVHEHLACRHKAGLFDVSHMGRFVIGGSDAPLFLQKVLSNNCAALEVLESQYTIIPDHDGYAIDDGYLYRFEPGSYLLVVNAANSAKDWRHFTQTATAYQDLQLREETENIAMLSLQGPESKAILSRLLDSGARGLPLPMRNHLSEASLGGTEIRIARTGYTGEPLGFELFLPRADAARIWEMLLAEGAEPVGLGARDTLRLEAGLPLYGHEFGVDAEDQPIPVFACPLARFAVSFAPQKGDFIGREALLAQFATLKRIIDFDYHDISSLPRLIQPIAVVGRGIAREGCRVLRDGKQVGPITSGTMVPYWKTTGTGIDSHLTGDTGKRAIALALIDADITLGEQVAIEIRGKTTSGVVVPYHLRTEAPPWARAVLWDQLGREVPAETRELRVPEDKAAPAIPARVIDLLQRAADNSDWRSRHCINLIPSEMSPSTLTRLLSVQDPCGRYAEHKKVKAFLEEEVFYYQGTEFIADVENLLATELQSYLGCRNVESRVISGQMANTAVFSGLVDHLNRADRKSEQRRLRKVMNNHILNGGHLSAQPMGALRDFVARDPHTEKPAVVNFPVLPDNPYRIDVAGCRHLMEIHRPELIILGKSMTIYPEPVQEMRSLVTEFELDAVIMYDMAHVLGLVGPYFQQPFGEGADLVTGSTHKTFFGTQRGIVAGNFADDDRRYPLWEAIERRTFPGSVSNHHLGTLLGLLMATYEMNAFKDGYQRQVIANARAFAQALADLGLDVAGEAGDGYTHTHQVILHVGYAKGPEYARRLEENNIIVNYQATHEEEGFTASGALRMGVAEMTRFGMVETDFQELAELLHGVIVSGKEVEDKITSLRRRFSEMHFCFGDDGLPAGLLDHLHRSL